MKKRPLKIAFIADALDYQYAGIYYYTKEILYALARVDKDNEYYFVRSKSEGDISPNVQEIVIPTGSFLGAAAYRLFLQIPKKLTQMQMDIVVEPRHFGPFNLPKNIKRVTFIHDLSPLRHPEWHQLVSSSLQKLFLPHILKKADRILTNSNFTKQDIIDYFPFTKNKVSPTLLGKETFFKPQPNPKAIESMGITAPYILHVGTIEPRKNLTVLLRAFEEFKQHHKKALQLVLVGKKGWKNDAFFQELAQSPFRKDIHSIGYVSRKNLVALYSTAEAFVYPSLFEGFGLPILEAMACGCPVIASNVASLPEIGGKACLYFSPNSVNQLVKQLNTVLYDASQRAKMTELSLQQAAKFSWDHTAKKTLEILERLVQ